jgi:hypothetical protein
MNHLNPSKTARALGAFFAVVHVIWSVIVALGLAQTLINFKLWAHMLTAPVVVNPFDLSAAITVIIAAAITGYIVGYIFATVWNKTHR